MYFLLFWISGSLASLLLYMGASLLFDGKIAFSSWIWLGLGVVALLGPLGTLLTVRFLRQIAAEVRREKERWKRSERLPGTTTVGAEA